MELAYLDDPSDILDRSARDFFVGALTPIISREKMLDLGPNTLDEALAAAQRYESNQKVLNLYKIYSCTVVGMSSLVNMSSDVM